VTFRFADLTDASIIGRLIARERTDPDPAEIANIYSPETHHWLQGVLDGIMREQAVPVEASWQYRLQAA
jgi:hypothetical protein